MSGRRVWRLRNSPPGEGSNGKLSLSPLRFKYLCNTMLSSICVPQRSHDARWAGHGRPRRSRSAATPLLFFPGSSDRAQSSQMLLKPLPHPSRSAPCQSRSPRRRRHSLKALRGEDGHCSSANPCLLGMQSKKDQMRHEPTNLWALSANRHSLPVSNETQES